MIIIGLLFAFWAIWHMWTHTTLQDGWKWGLTILLVLTGWVGALLYFLLRKQLGVKSDKNPMYEDIENAVAECEEDNQLKDKYIRLTITALLHKKMSVDEKCQVLELINLKIEGLVGNDVQAYEAFFLDVIGASYRLLEKAFSGSMIMTMESDKFWKGMKEGKLEPWRNYFGSIMTYTGLISSPDGKFSLKYKIFDRYNLPDFNKFCAKVQNLQVGNK